MPKPVVKFEKKPKTSTYYLTCRTKSGKDAAFCNKQPEKLIVTSTVCSDLVSYIETYGKKDCLYTIYKKTDKDPIIHKEKWLWRNYEKREENNGGVKEYASENRWCKMIGSWDYYKNYICPCCTASYDHTSHTIPECLQEL